MVNHKKKKPKSKPTKTVGLVIYGDCKTYEIWQAIKFEVKLCQAKR